MTDNNDNLTMLFQVSEVVGKSTDLEECILEVMEEMAKLSEQNLLNK
jgi:hypothetical protein